MFAKLFFSLWTRYKEVFNYLCYLLSSCSLQKLERKTLPVLEKVGKVFYIFYAACSYSGLDDFVFVLQRHLMILMLHHRVMPFFLETEIEN